MATRYTGIESVGSSAAARTQAERRRGNRLALHLKFLVRPSAVLPNDFEEECTSVNIARDGFYFLSSPQLYRRGMQLNVTWIYSPLSDGRRPNYVGKIVRVDPLSAHRCGVAVQLVQPIFA
ncbi:MAG: hypothetical protein M1453_06750 [Acidobacteria bacterium]|nr:hypothetical protein [Acidobacteriota bacterium]